METSTVHRVLSRGQSRRTCLAGLAALALGTSIPAGRAGAAENGSPYAKHVRSFLGFRQKNVVLQRWDLSCGAASLATLLAYQHRDPVAEREIAEAMLKAGDPERVRQHLGFSLLDLKRYVQARGYQGEGYGNVSLPDLATLAPAIVPIRVMTYDHFVVFRGFAQGRAALADSAFGNRMMLIERFLEVWKGRIAFVVRQPGAPQSQHPLMLRDEDLQLVDRALIRVGGT